MAEGAGIHVVNGIEHEASKGDIFLINYDIPHEFISKGEPLLIYNCIFTPAFQKDNGQAAKGLSVVQ